MELCDFRGNCKFRWALQKNGRLCEKWWAFWKTKAQTNKHKQKQTYLQAENKVRSPPVSEQNRGRMQGGKGADGGGWGAGGRVEDRFRMGQRGEDREGIGRLHK